MNIQRKLLIYAHLLSNLFNNVTIRRVQLCFRLR